MNLFPVATECRSLLAQPTALILKLSHCRFHPNELVRQQFLLA
jgi:hypothetical protein